MKLCGCVVLYNPEDTIIYNIKSYVDEVDVLYILDNSTKKNDFIVQYATNEKKCKYMDMNGNRGIAVALNRALKRAKKNGYQWLLTMDQDSVLPTEQLKQMKNYIEKLQQSDIAIVCPRYRGYRDNRKRVPNDVSYVQKTITSASIMNVDIGETIGGFDNRLFIDEVDHEYCFRAIENGYKIIRLNNVVFEHYIGKQKKVNGIVTYNYPPFRYYYIIRNESYVLHKYGKNPVLEDACSQIRSERTSWLMRVSHEKQMIKKYGYMLLGYIHFLTGKMGKL